VGQLVDDTGRIIELASRHRIGRDPWSDLVVDDPGVSGAHAIVLWTGAAWAARDLGSRNGTVRDGQPMPVGEPVPLVEGTELRVGPRRLVLRDESAPRPMIAGPAGVVLLEAAASVPGSEVFLVPGPDGDWWLDDGTGQRRLSDRLVFEAGGQRWTAYLEGALKPTREDGVPGGAPVIKFRVSRDEEHVDLWLRGPATYVQIPPRAHHYTLVTLARQRLADRAAGVAEPDAGWMATHDLCRQLRLQRGAVYTHLYRARKQLIEAGYPAVAERLVEHRTEAAQLRLGMPHLEVDDA